MRAFFFLFNLKNYSCLLCSEFSFFAIFLSAFASLNAQVKRPTNVFDASALDKPAVFKGGQEALMQYLAANLKYPDQARLDKAEARGHGGHYRRAGPRYLGGHP